jgi:hypothetical protein
MCRSASSSDVLHLPLPGWAGWRST